MSTITIATLTPAGELSTAIAGDSNLLPILQSACDGYVQAIDLTPTMTMWCNEDGKFNGSEWNECATAIWHAIYGPSDTIFGTVVFTGGADEDGETQGITVEDITRLQRVADAYKAAMAAGFAGV